MGYWQIPENAKRPLSHYAALTPITLRMLAGQHLIFFSDNVVVHRWIEEQCRASGVQVVCITKPVERLPALELAGHLVKQTALFGANTQPPANFNQEKGLWHYWRDFKVSGAAAYQKILAVWLSKVLLVGELIQSDPFRSTHFAWVDATASRFNGQRRNWNFVDAPDRPGVISHYSSAMRKHGRALSLNASFLKGNKQAWAELTERYLHELNLAIEEPYPNDEETLLHNVVQNRSEFFWVLDRDSAAPPGAAGPPGAAPLTGVSPV
jgi:hypothetical protein